MCLKKTSIIQLRQNSLVNFPNQPIYKNNQELTIIICLPHLINCNYIIFKLNNKFNCYFYTNKFFINIFISKLYKHSEESKYLMIHLDVQNYFEICNITKNFYNLYLLTKYSYFNCIKYSGKAYRIIKKKKKFMTVISFFSLLLILI
jgi:hypothetical protein